MGCPGGGEGATGQSDFVQDVLNEALSRGMVQCVTVTLSSASVNLN